MLQSTVTTAAAKSSLDSKPHLDGKMDSLNALDDCRIQAIKPLIPPQILMEDLPLNEQAYQTISRARQDADRIIKGVDDRLLVVVGPCSIHDSAAALEYAKQMRRLLDDDPSIEQDLLIVMRVYFEKPRTTVGWKGLINDPMLNNSFQINKGLRLARSLLLKINGSADIQLPTGCEFLDTISPQYIGDLVSWGAIGARTTESQVHRELASGLSMPVGFKNGTDGNVQIAVDAIKAAKEPHHFLSVTKQGLSAIVCTSGNDSCHVILRGGAQGPNYSAADVKRVCQKLQENGVNNIRLMIDCSHGNSEKNHKNQAKVVASICQQLANGGDTADLICGVMLESHLIEGKQDLKNATGPCGPGLIYGQSITDACIGWPETVQLLKQLQTAVKARRSTLTKRTDDETVVDF